MLGDTKACKAVLADVVCLLLLSISNYTDPWEYLLPFSSFHRFIPFLERWTIKLSSRNSCGTELLYSDDSERNLFS